MTTLLERLRGFDWYYGYSDDHRVWKRGKKNMASLCADLKALNCPHDISDLRRVAHEQVDDLYQCYEDGGYYKPALKTKWSCVASTKPDDMVTRLKYNEILDWIEAQNV